jgi:2-polyprenyl-3-methyl-5-hydroxy-6-metoxy-1,4-benzoquinol methylase
MKPLDRLLQRWRILKAKPHIPKGSRVLDVGSADGLLYQMLGDMIQEYVGIDPILETSIHKDNYQLISGKYPEDLPTLHPFSVITMLAVFEHIPMDREHDISEAIYLHLETHGKFIITTPSPFVDPLLHLMKRLRLIDGMALEEHGDLNFRRAPQVFGKLDLLLHQRFQLGLNHLFVFQKS